MSGARRTKRAGQVGRGSAGRNRRKPAASPVPGVHPPSEASLPFAKASFSGWLIWISIALIALTILAYWPVSSFDFVEVDDPAYVRENSHVAEGLTRQNLIWALTAREAANWHPLTWWSHMLDVELFGMNPGAHHITNLILHLANSLLLFGILFRMTGALGRSAFVAGLFALHPLHVESVAWIAERKDILSTLFWMASLWAYFAYVRRPKWGRYLVVLLLFALGLMAKPMVVTLPFVLLLLDGWPLKRVVPGSAGSRSPKRPEAWFRWRLWRPLVWEKLPLILLAAASSIVTLVVQHQAGAVSRLDTLPMSVRIENALVAYVTYIGKMFWPSGLAILYPMSGLVPGWWVGAGLLLLAVTVGVVRMAGRCTYLAVGWAWFLGTLVPVIGLVQVGGQTMADRYTYIPLIGLFVMAAWGIQDLLRRLPLPKWLLPGAALMVLAGLTAATRQQVQYWKDNNTLWRHTLEVTLHMDDFRAHNALGKILRDENRTAEAIDHFQAAIRLKPDFAEPHYNLGLALANQDQTAQAVSSISEALRLQPDYAEAHNALGLLLEDQGEANIAIKHYNEAVRIKPEFAAAHDNLGLALAKQGRLDEAILHYNEALRLRPGFDVARLNLGVALANQGKLDEAMREYREALKLRPDFELAHFYLGAALADSGRFEEAARHFSEALRINPGSQAAREALDILAKQGISNAGRR